MRKYPAPLVVLIGAVVLWLGGIVFLFSRAVQDTGSIHEAFRGLLGRSSNCGGNSAALHSCCSYAMLVRIAASDDHGVFDFDKLSEPEKAELASETTNRWIANVGFFLRRGTLDLEKYPKAVLIVCDTLYDNVPQPTFWNGHKRNPAYAVGYADGSAGLISLSQFQALDRSAFVNAADFFTHTPSEISDP